MQLIYHRPIIRHHFSHVHATFWLGIEQCSNRRRKLADKSGAIWIMTHVPETGAGEMESIGFIIYSAGFWNVTLCHGYMLTLTQLSDDDDSLLVKLPLMYILLTW